MKKFTPLTFTAIFLFNFSAGVYATEQPIYFGDTKYPIKQNVLLLDSNDTGGDVTIQMGNALNESISWDSANTTFDFSDAVSVEENSTGTVAETGLTVENAGTGDSLLQFLLTGVQRWVVGIDNSDDDKFKIAGSTDLDTDTRLTIDTSGNVGIGTTAPASGMLEISSADNNPFSMIRTSAGQWMNMIDGIDTFGLYNRAGTPEANIAADMGSLSIDTASGALYIKTTDTTNTGWLGLDAKSVFSAYDAVGGTAIPGVWTDITLDTERRKDADFTHTTDSAEITINESGWYDIEYHVSISRGADSSSRNRVVVRLREDTGGGYTEIPGSRALAYPREVDYGTVATQRLYRNFTAGTKIKIQANSDEDQSITTEANGTNLNIVGGSASFSNPSLTAAGNTGEIQFNTIGAFDASSTLFWDNAQSFLGVGVSTPLDALHITGNDPAIRLETTSVADESTRLVRTDTNTLQVIDDDIGTVFTIRQDGRVGIGNDATPNAELQLTDDQNDLTEIRIDNANAGTDIYHTGLTFYNGDTLETFLKNNNNTHLFSFGQNDAAGELAIYSGGLERMRLDQDGNLGIGTIVPEALFDISEATQTELIRLTDETSSDSVGFYTGDGDPNATVAAEAGSMYLDQVGKTYVNTDGTTAWTDLSAGGDASDFDAVYDQSVTNSNTTMEIDNGPLSYNLVGAGNTFTINDDGVAALHVADDGTVGIGTNTPDSTYALDVNGNLRVNDKIYSTDDHLYLEAAAGKYIEFKPKHTGDLGLVIRENDSTDYGNIFVGDGLELGYKTASTTVRIDNDGILYSRKIAINLSTVPSFGVQIYASSPYANAEKGYSGGWVVASDGRFKTNKTDILDGIDKIMLMKPIYYDWLETITDNETGEISVGGLLSDSGDMGFVAQDLNEIVPGAVSPPDDETKGKWAIDYGKLTPIIVSAIQEQQTTIEILEVENTMLKTELCARDNTYSWCE